MEKQTTATAVATQKEEVLKKRLVDLTFDEIKNNFSKVYCQLRKVKFGKGNNANTSYRAVLLFKEGIFELTFNLTQAEYNNIIARRSGDTKYIPDSYKTVVYYLPVQSSRTDDVTGEKRVSYQVKVAFSGSVRKKIWLKELDVDNALLFKAINFIDNSYLAEEDVDSNEVLF